MGSTEGTAAVAGTADETQWVVRSAIAEVLGTDVEEVTIDRALEGGLAVDSLALIEIGVVLEERLPFTMPDFDTPDGIQVKTVGDLVSLVEAEIAKGGNGR